MWLSCFVVMLLELAEASLTICSHILSLHKTHDFLVDSATSTAEHAYIIVTPLGSGLSLLMSKFQLGCKRIGVRSSRLPLPL